MVRYKIFKKYLLFYFYFKLICNIFAYYINIKIINHENYL